MFCFIEKIQIKISQEGSSLVVQRLGLRAPTAGGTGSSLVGKLRSHKTCGAGEKKKKISQEEKRLGQSPGTFQTWILRLSLLHEVWTALIPPSKDAEQHTWGIADQGRSLESWYSEPLLALDHVNMVNFPCGGVSHYSRSRADMPRSGPHHKLSTAQCGPRPPGK